MVQEGIMEVLGGTLHEQKGQIKALEEFIGHVSQQLVEAMKRGKPEITKSIVLQINCLKALHGIQVEQMQWNNFMQKVALILKIGVVFLL
jgi:hypothetical protein